MDTVVRQLTAEYCAKVGLKEWPRADQFEVFATHCVLYDHALEPFDAVDFRVGGSADGGIDGYAVALNGRLFRTPGELERCLAVSAEIAPTIVIVQAKTSHKMDRKFISDLRVRVENIMRTDLPLDNAADVEPLRECLRVIGNHMHRLSGHGVRLAVAYASTGSIVNDEMRREAARAAASLESQGFVAAATFECLGRDELIRLHERSQWSAGAKLRFDAQYSQPAGSGITQARYGVVPAQQLVDALRDGDESLNPTLFSENIREYHPSAAVNDEIRQTLRDPKRRQHFAVLNNGVTVVARFVRVLSDVISMRDFQIVNGCQTCHVLAGEYDHLEGVAVKVQVIECDDDEIINDIVTATNRQTEISKIYFANRRNLIRRLEVYYRHQWALGRPIALGRKPIRGATDLRNGVVGLNNQLRAYVAMFGPLPPANSYRDLDDQFDKLFGHALEPEFYAAAAALYRWEWLVDTKRVRRVYRYLSYQALAVVGLMFEARDTRGSEKDRIARVERMEAVIWSDGQWERLGIDVQAVLEEALSKLGITDEKNAGASREFGKTVVALAQRSPRT